MGILVMPLCWDRIGSYYPHADQLEIYSTASGPLSEYRSQHRANQKAGVLVLKSVKSTRIVEVLRTR